MRRAYRLNVEGQYKSDEDAVTTSFFLTKGTPASLHVLWKGAGVFLSRLLPAFHLISATIGYGLR